MGPPGYLQQPQFVQQQPQFFQRGEQAQQGMAQPPYIQPQAQPQQFFGQAGQFPGGPDIFQRTGRAQPDVPRSRAGPKNYTRSDERIRELICERLTQDLSIDVSDVGVEVQGGRVSLAGTVPDRQMKHAIEDVVDNCWGVQDIENNIHVQLGREADAQPATAPGGRVIAQAGGGFAAGAAGPTGKGRSKEE